MSGVSDAVARAGGVVFELDRFAIADDNLCVVEGCWFGVRGRRFIRPSLTVTVDGNETRLLADLADKPWAAEDGEPWKATFPVAVEIRDIEKAELAVAPDITIALRGSPDAADSRKRKPARRPSQRSRTQSRPDPGERQRRELARELQRVEGEKAQAQARLDELLGQLSRVVTERDEASAERDRLTADREAAAAASEAAQLARDRALADRDAAIAAQRRAESDRDLAIAECDRALSEREGAIALRDHAVAERDAAAAARDELTQQRDALAGTSARLQSELAELSSTRGAALVMRRAVQERSHSRRSPVVGPVAIATLVLLAVVVVMIVARAL